MSQSSQSEFQALPGKSCDGPFQVICPVCHKVARVQKEKTAQLTVTKHQNSACATHADGELECEYYPVTS